MHEPLSIFGPFIRLSLSNFAGPVFTAVHGQREEVCLLMSERPLCGRLSLPESSLQKEEGKPGVWARWEAHCTSCTWPLWSPSSFKQHKQSGLGLVLGDFFLMRCWVVWGKPLLVARNGFRLTLMRHDIKTTDTWTARHWSSLLHSVGGLKPESCCSCGCSLFKSAPSNRDCTVSARVYEQMVFASTWMLGFWVFLWNILQTDHQRRLFQHWSTTLSCLKAILLKIK